MGNGLPSVIGLSTKPGQMTETPAVAGHGRAQPLAQRPERRLARAIGGRRRHPPETGERAHDGDLPAPAGRGGGHLQHRLQRRVDRVDHARDVDGEDLPGKGVRLAGPTVRRAARGLGLARDSGIGDDEVERAAGARLGDPGGHAPRFGDVLAPRDGARAPGAAVGGDGLEPVAVAPAEMERDPLRGIGPGERRADPRRCPRDQNLSRPVALHGRSLEQGGRKWHDSPAARGFPALLLRRPQDIVGPHSPSPNISETAGPCRSKA
jgi:hypothetical protein